MRIVALLVCGALVGCGPLISSKPYSGAEPGKEPAGTPYSLPVGLVPVKVFADEKGVGITIEPAQLTIDSKAGTLVASLSPSPFNDEVIKISASPDTGFLTAVSTDSDAQIQAIVEEAAKSAARLALQSARASFLSQRVVVFDDSFNPLEPTDVERINRGLAAALGRAQRAYVDGAGKPLSLKPIGIEVAHSDGTSATGGYGPVKTDSCKSGLCVRGMTSRLVRITFDGSPFASKLVHIPTHEVVGVPVPSTLFADQDIAIGIQDGILKQYDVTKKSEALGLVQIPGAILNGIVAGVTQGLGDQKTVADKSAELAKSQEDLAKAKESRNKAVESLGSSSLNLQSGTTGEGGEATYSQLTLTVYPFSEALARAVEERIGAIAAGERGIPGEGESQGGDLVVPAPLVPPQPVPPQPAPAPPAPAAPQN